MRRTKNKKKANALDNKMTDKPDRSLQMTVLSFLSKQTHLDDSTRELTGAHPEDCCVCLVTEGWKKLQQPRAALSEQEVVEESSSVVVA